MMASRRCASPTVPEGDTHAPVPSGPRWAIVSRMASSSVRLTGPAWGPIDKTPAMPHIGAASVPAGGPAGEEGVDRQRHLDRTQLLIQGHGPGRPAPDGVGEGGQLL